MIALLLLRVSSNTASATLIPIEEVEEGSRGRFTCMVISVWAGQDSHLETDTERRTSANGNEDLRLADSLQLWRLGRLLGMEVVLGMENSMTQSC